MTGGMEGEVRVWNIGFQTQTMDASLKDRFDPGRKTGALVPLLRCPQFWGRESESVGRRCLGGVGSRVPGGIGGIGILELPGRLRWCRRTLLHVQVYGTFCW